MTQIEQIQKLHYLIDSLLNLAETNIEMHLLLLQLATFLIEQVGVLVDEVQVVARSDGHRVTASFSQSVVRLFREDINTLIMHQTVVVKYWLNLTRQ